eukprot:1146520-Pelagomonas_calceolata.AAC.7
MYGCSKRAAMPDEGFVQAFGSAITPYYSEVLKQAESSRVKRAWPSFSESLPALRAKAFWQSPLSNRPDGHCCSLRNYGKYGTSPKQSPGIEPQGADIPTLKVVLPRAELAMLS